MQFISKKLSMPVQVEDWVKNEKPNGWTLGKDYKDGYEILREQLRPEQKNLCCYCCQALELGWFLLPQILYTKKF